MISPKRGFYSVVQRDDQLIVRARCKEDIDRLADLIPGEPIKKPSSDYLWHLPCSHDDWALACDIMAREIDYTNVKNEARLYDAWHASVYHDVWLALVDLEPTSERESSDD